MRKLAGAEIYLLKASSPEIKALWIKSIKECHDKKRPGLLKGLALFSLLSKWVRKRPVAYISLTSKTAKNWIQFKKTPSVNLRNAVKEILSVKNHFWRGFLGMVTPYFSSKNETLEICYRTLDVWTARFGLISMRWSKEFFKKYHSWKLHSLLQLRVKKAVKKRPGLLKGLALFSLLSKWVRKRPVAYISLTSKTAKNWIQFKKTPSVNLRNAVKEILSVKNHFWRGFLGMVTPYFSSKNETLEICYRTLDVWTARFGLISMRWSKEFFKKYHSWKLHSLLQLRVKKAVGELAVFGV